jgi:hypothetical protein
MVGAVPSELGACRALTHLSIGSNGFGENLPLQLAQLTQLERFYANVFPTSSF